MRILQLRFKNLNSLAGEWSIDFTNPAYVSSGIFAITGPTGSGKTTILDAICLALYGQTPRLKTISKSTNEIMTRNTVECFAEVVFESQVGRFVCHWSQRRAYRKPDGDLQPPRHEISDFVSGKVLENKLHKVTEKVIQTTGLDYSQFTRSILLAQGDFAAFMNANADERAPILEKITGTAIYSEISKKVHERNTDEAGKRKELKDKLGNLDILSPDKIAELRRTYEETEAEVRHLVWDQALLRQAAEWAQNISRLEKEIAELNEQKGFLEEKQSKAVPHLTRLHNARKCLPFEEVFGKLLSSRGLVKRYEGEREAAKGRLNATSADCIESARAYEEAKTRLDTLRANLEEEKPVLLKVRDLDIRIMQTNQQIEEKKTEIKSLEEKIQKLQRSISDAKRICSEKKTHLSQASAYLKEHEVDSRLTEILSGLGERMGQYEHLTKLLQANRGLLASRKAEVSRLMEADHSQAKLLAETEQAFKKATEAFEKIRAANDLHLDYRGPGFWRACASSLKERRSRIESEIKIHQSIEKIGEKIRELTEQRALLDLELEKKKEVLSCMKEKQHLKGEVLAKIETNLEILYRIESLEEARNHLLDGEPCPLCGSLDHPYTGGNVPCSDEVKSEWGKIKEELRVLSDQINLQEVSVSELEAEIRSNVESETERNDQIRELFEGSELGFDDVGVVTNTRVLKNSLAHALVLCDFHYTWCSEIFESSEMMEQRLKDAHDALSRAKDRLARVRTLSSNTEIELKMRSNVLTELEDQVATNAYDQTVLHQELSAALHDFGIDFTKIKTPADILQSLEKRKKGFEKNFNQQRDLENQIQLINNDIVNNQNQLKENENSTASLLLGIVEIERINSGLSLERYERYGTKNPDIEEKKIADNLKFVETEFQNAFGTVKEHKTRIESLQEQITDITGKLEEARTSIGDLETMFFEGIQSAGFSGEEEFISARVPHDQFANLEKMESDLLFEERDLLSKINDRTTILSLERSRDLTEKSLDTLIEEISGCESTIADLNQKLGSISQVLQNHDRMMAQQNEIVQNLEKQEIECLRWERLHDLIGSSDGKKFRVFAQGLTFDRLIAQANRHLRKMSDRYLLMRGANSSLDLDIMDNYQAGEIRSTKNLSGGESFIVSLALALGLSGMASRNVRIDSLFLDEGFGTLDNDTLEIALETLSTLQQEGKIIGVISHVPALKERISTKIVVEKITGGISILRAPGCTFTGNS